ncbi:MAG: hypothetical protein GWN71_01615, partial [Gammaproteobacteria bacterium]|nr:hypothetical protein [Gemmatimonadota bacterium]NIU72311.1 hypothetical protein [Gammaproteobacteria bacterium]
MGQRTHELGVRMALGADRIRVVAAVLRRGLGLAGVGLALGIGLALAASRVLQAMLFEVDTLD